MGLWHTGIGDFHVLVHLVVCHLGRETAIEVCISVTIPVCLILAIVPLFISIVML